MSFSILVVPLLLLSYCLLIKRILELVEEREKYKRLSLEDKRIIFKMAKKIERLQHQLKGLKGGQ